MSIALRLLLFIAIGLLVWRLLRHILRPLEPHEQDQQAFEKIDICQGCKTHVPTDQLQGEPPRCAQCRSRDNAPEH